MPIVVTQSDVCAPSAVATGMHVRPGAQASPFAQLGAQNVSPAS